MEKGRIFNLVGIGFIIIFTIGFIIFASIPFFFIALFSPLVFGFIGYKNGDKKLGKILILIGIIFIAFIIFAIIFSCPGPFCPPFEGMNSQKAWNTGCALAAARGCLQASFGINGTPLTIPEYDGEHNTILDACEAVYGYTDPNECRARCCGG